MSDLTVYVNVTSPVESNQYGETSIVIKKDDPHRSGYLKSCEDFFKINGRAADADKFYQARKQTPWDPSDDGG